MRDKYANKSRPARFFHKYTGFIVASILITVVGIVWYVSVQNQVFFEYWPCESFISMNETGLNEIEIKRLHEIKDDCHIR